MFIILDNLNNGAEERHCISVDDDIMGTLMTSAPAAPIKKDGTPFLPRWTGTQMLTDEEQVRIREMRMKDAISTMIAKELHISNRVISNLSNQLRQRVGFL